MFLLRAEEIEFEINSVTLFNYQEEIIVEFKAKLNAKFYTLSVVMLLLVALVAYGVYFMSATQILGEDGLPMSSKERSLFGVLLSIVGISWLISFLTMLGQIAKGCAFEMDESGIHKTTSAVCFLAFIFVVTIRTIPYEAIKSVSEKNGMLTAEVDKSKLDMPALLRFFARKEYNFFYSVTKVSL